MKECPKLPQELQEIKQNLQGKELAAFLVGTSWPEMTYEEIAQAVDCDRKTLWRWRQEEKFVALAEKYGEKYIDAYWLPLVRAQIRQGLKGDTKAFQNVAKVRNRWPKETSQMVVDPQVARLMKMSDEELRAHIAELKQKRGQESENEEA